MHVCVCVCVCIIVVLVVALNLLWIQSAVSLPRPAKPESIPAVPQVVPESDKNDAGPPLVPEVSPESKTLAVRLADPKTPRQASPESSCPGAALHVDEFPNANTPLVCPSLAGESRARALMSTPLSSDESSLRESDVMTESMLTVGSNPSPSMRAC